MLITQKSLEKKITKLIHWFMPEDFKLDSQDRESIKFYHRSLLTISLCLSIGLALLPLQFYRYLNWESINSGIHAAPIALTLSILSLIEFKVYGRQRCFYFFLYALIFLLLPLKIIALGVSSWPLIIWAFLTYIISTKMIPIGIALVGLIYNLFLIKYSFINNIKSTLAVEDIDVLYTSAIPAVLALLLFELLHHKIKISIRSIKKEQEKNTNLKKLITSLNHEINNPLMIATGSLEHYQSHKDDKLLKRISKALERISEILKTIRKLETFESTNYAGNYEMIQIIDPQSEGNTQKKETSIKKEETNSDLKKYQEELTKLLKVK